MRRVLTMIFVFIAGCASTDNSGPGDGNDAQSIPSQQYTGANEMKSSPKPYANKTLPSTQTQDMNSQAEGDETTAPTVKSKTYKPVSSP